MGIVVIHCPKTGKCISTGMHIDRAAFGSMPVFFGRSFFPGGRVGLYNTDLLTQFLHTDGRVL